MIHRLEKLYEGDTLRGPVVNLAQMLSTVDGDITEIEIFCPGVVLGTTIYNVRVNGVALFAGGSRPTLAAGSSSVTKTGLSVAVVVGDLIRLDVDSLGPLGMASPITMIVLIDDGVIEASGDVVGPAAATDNAIALFDGVTGKLLQDSAVTISTDGTLASDSDDLIPTEKAVKQYVDDNSGGSSGQIVAVQTFWKVNSANTTLDNTNGAVNLNASVDWLPLTVSRGKFSPLGGVFAFTPSNAGGSNSGGWGLSTDNVNAEFWDDVPFSWQQLTGGAAFKVVELGVTKYTAVDATLYEFRIEVSSVGVVTYYRNNVLVYTSAATMLTNFYAKVLGGYYVYDRTFTVGTGSNRAQLSSSRLEINF
jgi:hypothetical protein